MENLERQGSGFTTIALPPEKTEHSECAAPEAEVAYPNGEAKSRDGSGPDLPTDTIDDKQASLSNEREKKESPRKEGRFMSLMEGIFQKKKQAQSQADSEPSKKEDSTSPRERKQEEAEATTTENGRIISVATRENRYVEAEEAQTATSPANLFRIYQDACKAAQVQPNSKAIAQLQRAILENTALSALELGGSQLWDKKNCEPLVELLEHNTVHLTTLNMTGVQLKDSGIEVIAKAIPKLRRLSRIYLGQNSFSNMKPLIDITKSGSLLHLDLSENDFRGSRGVTLGSALSATTSLKILVLSQTKLSYKAVVAIAESMKTNTSIIDLQLGGNDIDARSAIHLAHMLHVNSTLLYIDLRNNQIRDKGTECIAESLQANQTIKGLNLWNNRIGHAGVQSVATMLVNNNSIEDLNMGNNLMEEQSTIVLKAALLQNFTLMRLGLAKCGIGSEGAICLAEALAGNSSLRSLDIRQNDIGIAGLMALALSVKVNTALCHLSYDGDDTLSEGALERGFQVDIAESCKRNKEELHRQLEEEKKRTSVRVSDSSPTERYPAPGENSRARAATMVDETLNESDLQEIPL